MQAYCKSRVNWPVLSLHIETILGSLKLSLGYIPYAAISDEELSGVWLGTSISYPTV